MRFLATLCACISTYVCFPPVNRPFLRGNFCLRWFHTDRPVRAPPVAPRPCHSGPRGPDAVSSNGEPADASRFVAVHDPQRDDHCGDRCCALGALPAHGRSSAGSVIRCRVRFPHRFVVVDAAGLPSAFGALSWNQRGRGKRQLLPSLHLPRHDDGSGCSPYDLARLIPVDTRNWFGLGSQIDPTKRRYRGARWYGSGRSSLGWPYCL